MKTLKFCMRLALLCGALSLVLSGCEDDPEADAGMDSGGQDIDAGE